MGLGPLYNQQSLAWGHERKQVQPLEMQQSHGVGCLQLPAPMTLPIVPIPSAPDLCLQQPAFDFAAELPAWQLDHLGLLDQPLAPAVVATCASAPNQDQALDITLQAHSCYTVMISLDEGPEDY